jgi:hypothetical protein
MNGTLYRKKPVVVEAMGPVDLMGSNAAVDKVRSWCGGEWIRPEEQMGHPPHWFRVPTPEGPMGVSDGDYIIKGTRGEFYPCKPDAFEDTFEIVEEEPEHDYDWAVALQGEAVADMN